MAEQATHQVAAAATTADTADTSNAITQQTHNTSSETTDAQAATDAATQQSEAAEAEDEELDVAFLKRQKVPLEPGFSQLHWMRYVRQAVRRPAKRYTLADIATHTDPKRSVWMAIRGQVYDVTAYLRYHPGGIPMLMKGAGKDCTRLFDKLHPYVNLDVMMAPLVIGTLVTEK